MRTAVFKLLYTYYHILCSGISEALSRVEHTDTRGVLVIIFSIFRYLPNV